MFFPHKLAEKRKFAKSERLIIHSAVGKERMLFSVLTERFTSQEISHKKQQMSELMQEATDVQMFIFSYLHHCLTVA